MTAQRPKLIVATLLTFVCALSAQAQAADNAAATKWKGLLGNQVLSQVLKDDGNSLQLGGTSIKTSAAGMATELHLCKDGSFVRMQRAFSGGETLQLGNLAAKSGPGGLLTKVSGKWKVAAADSVSAKVLLAPTSNADALDDEDRELNISFDGANTMVNDSRWLRMKSPACR